VRSALVIGFGGSMERLAGDPLVRALHIADLFYPSRRQEMDAALEGYRRQDPSKVITFSDGHDTARRLGEVDLVTVTGSALCNGTLDGLLDQARGGPRVIVQGQSAGIHPVALFRRGVSLVMTTLKPRELARRARADPSGSHLKPLLEGGLPWLYLLPRLDGRPALAHPHGNRRAPLERENP
jgi:hypothetical protein